MNKRASLSLPPPVSRDTGYKGGLFLTSSSFWTELQLGTTISCITSAYVRPEKGRRYADCSTRLPTPTDLGPRLRPIHEIILVHHLRASLVSRGCAPWITLTAPTYPPESPSTIMESVDSSSEWYCVRWLDKCFVPLFLFEYKFSRESWFYDYFYMQSFDYVEFCANMSREFID